MSDPLADAWNQIFAETFPEVTPQENWIRYLRGDYDTLKGLEADPRLYVRMAWFGWSDCVDSSGKVRRRVYGSPTNADEGDMYWHKDLLDAMRGVGYIK